jgi:hypothetical protein
MRNVSPLSKKVLLISFLSTLDATTQACRGKKSKLFIQTVDLPSEGEGEKGTNP